MGKGLVLQNAEELDHLGPVGVQKVHGAGPQELLVIAVHGLELGVVFRRRILGEELIEP